MTPKNFLVYSHSFSSSLPRKEVNILIIHNLIICSSLVFAMLYIGEFMSVFRVMNL